MIYSVIEHNLLNSAAKVEVIKTSHLVKNASVLFGSLRRSQIFKPGKNLDANVKESHLRCLQLIKALKVYGDWLWACKNREPVDIKFLNETFPDR